MAREVRYDRAAQLLESRIRERISKLGAPGDRRTKEALIRIGSLIERETKKNIQRRTPRARGPAKGLIDTGRLLNSIKFRLFNQQGSSGVRVGSFGVPYAAIHEFGFSGSQSVPQHERMMTQAFGRPMDPRLVTVQAHVRFMRIPARPFLGPAVRDNRSKIRSILKDMISGN